MNDPCLPIEAAQRRVLVRKRLLACSARIESHLNQKLRKEFDFTLARFDLLDEVARHPDGMKMSEVSSRLMVTAGNVTGLTDRLVAGGLLLREPDPHDGRSFTLRLTPAGYARHAELVRVCDGWLQTLIGDLGHSAETTLLHTLTALDTHLQQHLPPARGGRSGR